LAPVWQLVSPHFLIDLKKPRGSNRISDNDMAFFPLSYARIRWKKGSDPFFFRVMTTMPSTTSPPIAAPMRMRPREAVAGDRLCLDTLLFLRFLLLIAAIRPTRLPLAPHVDALVNARRP
jgi:hypothetical protein